MRSADYIEQKWETTKSRWQPGSVLKGKVEMHFRFGIYVSLGVEFIGLLPIDHFKDGVDAISPAEYPPVGEDLEAIVVGFDERTKQVRLSVRPSDWAKARGCRSYWI